jgi:hypothetical protein
MGVRRNGNDILGEIDTPEVDQALAQAKAQAAPAAVLRDVQTAQDAPGRIPERGKRSSVDWPRASAR